MVTGINKQYISDQYSVLLSNKYHLSIELETEQITCSVFDLKQKLWLGVEILPSHQILQSVFLAQNHGSVSLGFHTNQFDLIPLNLFQEENVKNLFEQFHSTNNKEETCFDALQTDPYALIYQLPKSVEKIISMHPNLVLKHAVAHLLHQGYPSSCTYAVKIITRYKKFYLSIRKGEELILINQFEGKTSEEVLYFLFYTLKTLNIPANDVHLFLSTDENRWNDFQTKLEGYFTNITPLKSTVFAQIDIQGANQIIHSQHFYHLIQQALCVL